MSSTTGRSHGYRIQSNHRKTAYALNLNAASFVEHYGLDYCGFLSLTFKQKLLPTVAAPCLNRAVRFFPHHFEDWIWTMGLGESRRPHYHALVACGFPIGENIDRFAYAELLVPDDGLSRIPPCGTPAERRRSFFVGLDDNPLLRDLRRQLYPRLIKIGFGPQIDLSPVLSDGPNIASYLEKNYLETVVGRDFNFRRCRLTGSRRGGHRVCRPPFAWSAQNRRRLAYRIIGNALGVTTYEGMAPAFGPKWGYLANLMILDLETHHGRNPRKWPQAGIRKLAADVMPQTPPDPA